MNIHGFDFPEDTVFVANLSKFLDDPVVFPKPKSVIPERFISISPEGKKQIKVTIISRHIIVYCKIWAPNNIIGY